jgi:hypothetical protein
MDQALPGEKMREPGFFCGKHNVNVMFILFNSCGRIEKNE